jgi:hypothetical protein
MVNDCDVCDGLLFRIGKRQLVARFRATLHGTCLVARVSGLLV